MDPREPRSVFRAPPRRLTARIKGHYVPFHSYYAHEPVEEPTTTGSSTCTLCESGMVRPLSRVEPTLEQRLAYRRRGLPIPERIEVYHEPEVCYRCEGTGVLLPEFRRRLSMEEAREFVRSLRS